MSFSPAGGANSATANPLAGFKGPRRGRGKRGKGKEGSGKERKERHPLPETNFWLLPCRFINSSSVQYHEQTLRYQSCCYTWQLMSSHSMCNQTWSYHRCISSTVRRDLLDWVRWTLQVECCCCCRFLSRVFSSSNDLKPVPRQSSHSTMWQMSHADYANTMAPISGAMYNSAAQNGDELCGEELSADY